MELADVRDSKSRVRKDVPVRPRSPAPLRSQVLYMEPVIFYIVSTLLKLYFKADHILIRRLVMDIKKRLYEFIINRRAKIVKNRWVFMSFIGHYSDNPKYLSIKLHELYPEIEIIWCVRPEYLSLLPEYVTGVEYGSHEAAKYMSSAEVIIDNVYGERAFNIFGNSIFNKMKAKVLSHFLYKKGQRIYSTWHGTPLKRMGRDQIGNNLSGYECRGLKMLLGNRFTMDIMKHLTFDKVPMEVLGSPRNDILFEHDADIIKKKLGLSLDKKILLFAPTFRNDGRDVEGKNLNRSGLDQLAMIDLDRLFKTLHERFGGDWAMVCRFHYNVSEMVDWGHLERKCCGRVINGNLHDDMSEYLSASDILITDASSCMFDYMITERPCFLFFPDIDNYANKERGFYIQIDELPFPMAVDFNELIDSIMDFNSDTYKEKVCRLKDRLGYMEDGNSSQRILEWIFKDAGGK